MLSAYSVLSAFDPGSSQPSSSMSVESLACVIKRVNGRVATMSTYSAGFDLA